MSIFTTEYSKYGDINMYIAQHHPKRERFEQYRKRWSENNNSKSELLYLLFETTSECNLRCPMCIHSTSYKHIEPMTVEVFEAGISGIKEMDIPSVAMNRTNEPLLDKNIFKRIKRIMDVENVVDTYIYTNALLLDEETSKNILESGITRMLIGFDGFSAKVYEQVRVGSDYKKVLANIERFLKLRKKMKKIFPVVRVSFVKNSINEHEAEAWFNFWKDKVDYISVQEYLTQVLSENKNYLIPKSSKRTTVTLDDITCSQPFQRAIILGDGSVLPCCAPFSSELCIGNIKKNSLKDIWNGAAILRLRGYFLEKKWYDHPICSKCLKITYEIKD
ncbi:MAG: radical SAM protein [Candidatus Omnitrophica bacterium]|nr:radical SAM protein [Candidatus Omnitrophota bacterium]